MLRPHKVIQEGQYSSRNAIFLSRLLPILLNLIGAIARVVLDASQDHLFRVTFDRLGSTNPCLDTDMAQHVTWFLQAPLLPFLLYFCTDKLHEMPSNLL